MREIGAGRSVAVIGGSRGLRAISSDGANERVLVPEPVWFVLVDTRANVIWYGVDQQIRAIDLEASAIVETTVLDNVPADPGMIGALNIEIAYPTPDPDEPMGMIMVSAPSFALSGAVIYRSITLAIWPDRAPEVMGTSGYEQDEEFDEAIEHVTLPGADFARSLAKRSPKPFADRESTKFEVPDVDPENCENADECGTATAIPGTHFARVVVASVTGDIAHVSLALYDGAAHKLVPGSEAWFGNAERIWLAPDGTAFVVSGAVVRYADGPLPSTPIGDSSGGGFLGGESFD